MDGISETHALAAIGGAIPSLLLALGVWLKSRAKKNEDEGEATVHEARATEIEASTEAKAMTALVESLTNARRDLDEAKHLHLAARSSELAALEALKNERQARQEEDERCRKNLLALARTIDDLRTSMGQESNLAAMLQLDNDMSPITARHRKDPTR